jgi:prolipoprotein diacylglyceryl transferase
MEDRYRDSRRDENGSPALTFEIPLSSFSRRLYLFAAKRRGGEALFRILKFLQVGEELKTSLYTIKRKTAKKAEQLMFYVIIGAIVGSRLGDLLFYQSWEGILRHPFSIFAVWEGGLASHGGAIGILIAFWIYAVRQKFPFWTTVDFAVIPTAIAAVFIRLGNFMNQEILGTPSTLPWAVLFRHPADGGAIVPRHPVQLYEAIWYLCTFLLLMVYWHRREPFKPAGRTTGLFLVLVFGFRFFIESIKVEQSAHLSAASLLTMGQMLSIPFIALGLFLFSGNRASAANL